MSVSDEPKCHHQSMCYQITVSGVVDVSWSEWFDGLRLTTFVDADGLPVTHLAGTVPDQGALRGILNRLWDLNLTLLSVKCKDEEKRRM